MTSARPTDHERCRALRLCRGGWEQVPDADVLAFWHALPAGVQAQYLDRSRGAPVIEYPVLADPDATLIIPHRPHGDPRES